MQREVSTPTQGRTLTNLTACQMVRGLNERTFSSRELVEAHIRQIEQVNPRLNAVVFTRFDAALHEADVVDQHRARGKPTPILAGLPVTLKECFQLIGTPSTVGLSYLVHEEVRENSLIVDALLQTGAIVIGKTNVPQLMVLHESDNPVYGKTNHPMSEERSPGGSTGGEAAIVAARGSPLGLGSDMGGSIRFPAHACGIAGFKPTSRRLTQHRVRGAFQGVESIGGQPGPMARNVEDLSLLLNALFSHGALDSLSPPVPWRPPDSEPSVQGMRVGIFDDDRFFRPSPAIRRAVSLAGKTLQHLGAEVVPFEVPDGAETVSLYFGIMSADGAQGLQRQIQNSRADRRVTRMIRIGSISPSWRSTIAWWLEGTKQSRLANLVRWTGALSADALWQLIERKNEFVERFHRSWVAAGIDVLIGPPHALPALRHGTSVDLTSAASYSFLANMLHAPAGVVPATFVQPLEETDRPASNDQVERTASLVESGSAGLPVGVQVIGRPWQDEIVLNVMQSLQNAWRGLNLP